jgi:hypothetical protein
MTDFPPSRPLPEGTRDRARHQLTEGMAEPKSPRRTPLLIAAAVVLLVAAGTVLAQSTRGGDAPLAVGPTSTPTLPNQLPPPDLVAMFNARDGWAPADVIDRCAAVADGLPPKERWRPIMTTVVHAVTLSVFSGGGREGVFFCETTPSSVTVSEASVPDTGGAAAKIAFITPNGSIAGFVRTPISQLSLHPDGPRAPSSHGLVIGDVFLAPQGFRGAEKGVTFVVDADQEYQAADVPQPSTQTVDRPQPPGDRASEDGRRLGACLDAAEYPAPDPSAWVPGAHVVLSATSEVQLARYGDLLAVCRVREHDQQSDVFVTDQVDIGGRYASGAQLKGAFVWGTGYFYDFAAGPDGVTSSDTRGFVGRVVDQRVATITLTREGFPDATAVVADGTFVLSGPAMKGLSTVPAGVLVTVRDAQGAVLEQFSPQG